MVRAAEPPACRDKGTKIWQTPTPLQLSKTLYLWPDMVTRANLDNGVATLATLWEVLPNEVAKRLAINLDFSHISPKPLSERAKRARRHQNTKYTQKQLRQASRALAPIVESTAQMIDNPQTFRKLRSMLMKAAYAKTQDRIQAEDLVQETILRVCTYEVKDEQHLFRLARQVLRRVITAYWRKEYNTPTTVTPHEDFYIMEEALGIYDDDEAENDITIEMAGYAVSKEEDSLVTSDIAEAFRRVATELAKQLGQKHAALACGMREKTLSRILAPWGQQGTDQPAENTSAEPFTSASPHAEHTASHQSHDHPPQSDDLPPSITYTPHSTSYLSQPLPAPEPHLSSQNWLSVPASDSAPPAHYTAYVMLLSGLAQLSLLRYREHPDIAAKKSPTPLNADYADTATPERRIHLPVSKRPPPPLGSA
jgi:DNA-directed RNA polymerase specialized sigma24 family protein